jgi:mannonate dehydratase
MTIQEHLSAENVTDRNLSFLRAIGVDFLTIYPLPALADRAEMIGYLSKAKALAATHGLELRNIGEKCPDAITLNLEGREAAIERWRQLLEAMGETGIPSLGYNFKPVTIFRTAPTAGRGAAAYSTFSYEAFKGAEPLWPDKRIDAGNLWGNMQYFLENVLPVAEASGVVMALHPDDPPIAEPLAGIGRIVSTLDHFRRIFGGVPSGSNAMVFCQGCVAEMGVDVIQAIREFVSLGKVAYVHFRNIRGNPRNFQEVFIDEGDVDMFEAMKAYRNAGFEGPFMMDHSPEIPFDRETREGRAFAVGYMRALIQAVYR